MESAAVEVKEADDAQNHLIIANKDLTRYKKRYHKRQWEESNTKSPENGEVDSKRLCGTTERVKRKKMAVLLGYCGVDYYGMQRNPGVRTIEEDLFKALYEAKYVTQDDLENQQNTQFQRSSRTDKGVSAARQVVSLKLPLEVDVNEINKNLPESIKVFGVKRVTNRFNSKSKCNARTYSYTLPTYAFEPSLVTVEERKQYRIPADRLEQVKKVLEVYKGTKSYHNFTEKKHNLDPSALRYMMSFTVDRVFVESDMEFAVLLVKGQSFMLHQIRKMVGVAIAVLRGHADKSILEKVFAKEKVITPTAPGLGLVLDMVHYDRYDTKFKSSHESLTWDEEESNVEKFKQEHIYPVIVKGEVEGDSMGLWLEKLSRHSFEPSDNPIEKDDETEVGDDDDDVDDDCEDKNDVTNPKDELVKCKDDVSDDNKNEGKVEK